LQDPSGHGPLLERHEVVFLPSASILATLRREEGGREPAPHAVAVLADPVFDAGDPRVEARSRASPAGTELVATAIPVRDAGLQGGLVRLFHSREEAAAILSVAPADSLSALDFDASRETVLGGVLGQYRIVHLATHGLLNPRHPELSGLVFSTVDRQGRPRRGFVAANEIYNLRLSADLVVLSACQTALGKEVRGEGLLSLTRGFMYAGAKRVVASTWEVADRATAELMRRFYAHLLKDGLNPAQALRAAQLELRREPRWSAAYYWAGFTLQGDWR
jgi:CHAT domain-containing protein